MATGQITERVETPPMQNAPPGSAPAPATLTADLEEEYLVGSLSTPGFIYQYFNTLPTLYSDDLEARLPEVYSDMAVDPKIDSQLKTIILEAVQEIPRYLPVVDPEDEGNPDRDRALEIKEFCERSIKRLEEPITGTAQQMAQGAATFGFKLSELVFEHGTGQDALKLMLCEINPKPRRAVAFVVDRFMKVVGILGLVNNLGGYIGYQQIVSDLQDVENLYPPEKFAVLRFFQVDRDPRGISWLRPIYTAWWRKLQLIGEYLKHCSQLAGGILKATLGEKAVQQRVVNPDGTTSELTAAQATFNQVSNVRNGGVVVLPWGATLDILAEPGGGTTLAEAIDREDKNISIGISFQELSTSDSAHNTRAASTVHADTRQLPVVWIRFCIEQMIYRILKFVVKVNYGPELVYLTPTVSMQDTPSEDMAALILALSKANWSLDAEQYPEADIRTGFKPRSEEAVQRAIEKQAQPPPVTPGQDGQDTGDDDEGNNEDAS